MRWPCLGHGGILAASGGQAHGHREPARRPWSGLDRAIDFFILERRAEKRRPKTIEDHRHHLGQFLGFLRTQDGSGDGPDDLTEAIVLAYRLHLQERPHLRSREPRLLENSSLKASQRVLRNFFGWALAEAYALDPRILQLKHTKVPEKDATVYTIEQVRAILAACTSPAERMAVKLAVGTGTRLSETSGVCLQGPDGLPDLETDTVGRGYGMLRVRWDAGAKGMKARRTPVAMPLLKAIRRHELRERPSGPA